MDRFEREFRAFAVDDAPIPNVEPGHVAAAYVYCFERCYRGAVSPVRGNGAAYADVTQRVATLMRANSASAREMLELVKWAFKRDRSIREANQRRGVKDTYPNVKYEHLFTEKWFKAFGEEPATKERRDRERVDYSKVDFAGLQERIQLLFDNRHTGAPVEYLVQVHETMVSQLFELGKIAAVAECANCHGRHDADDERCPYCNALSGVSAA